MSRFDLAIAVDGARRLTPRSSGRAGSSVAASRLTATRPAAQLNFR
jgi:hypothetical protein